MYPGEERCAGCGLPRRVHPSLVGDTFRPSGEEYVAPTTGLPFIYSRGRYRWRMPISKEGPELPKELLRQISPRPADAPEPSWANFARSSWQSRVEPTHPNVQEVRLDNQTSAFIYLDSGGVEVRNDDCDEGGVLFSAEAQQRLLELLQDLPAKG